MENQNNYSEEMIKKCEHLDRTGCILYKPSTLCNFSDFSQFYVYSTENIAGYINEFELENKSLMTVGSSGDQVISAISHGCTDITHFDINPYSKFYIYLKLASILALSQDNFREFIDYFIPVKLKSPILYRKFNSDLYKKIRGTLKALDKETFQTWEVLFDNYSPEIIKKALFSTDGTIINCDLSRIIPYLSSKSAYKETKAKIKKANINFLVGDIMEANFDRQFDNIWLSNIPQYLTLTDTKKMLGRLQKYLSKDGKMLMSYIYNAFLPVNVNYCPNVFKSYHPSLVQVGCCDQEIFDKNPNEIDEAIIYQKR